MNRAKNLLTLICCFFLLGCSFGAGTGSVWNDLSEELQKAKDRKDAKIIFTTKKKFREEIKNSEIIQIQKPSSNQDWKQQSFTFGNNIPHLIYQNKKNLIFKSKKIGKNSFDLIGIDFEPILTKNIIFFYDPSGTIFSYSLDKKKIVWKYNFYKKRYKNLPKDINLSISADNVIISDNLGFIYSLKKETGKINWAKNYGVPFKSNIKIEGDNVFLINQDNKFYVISERTGKQKLDLETFPSFLKSNSKPNISLDNKRKNIYFVTSSAEIYSINYKNRNINWLFNLTSVNTNQKVDLFYSSPLVQAGNEIILSSYLSTFSMDVINGAVNWEFPFSSNLTPLVTDNYVFFTSKEGFLLNLERKTGKIIWSRNIFDKLKKLKHKKTGDITSVLFLSNQIFLTTENGYFLFLDYQNGKIINYSKVAKGFFSKPIISNGKILIIDNKIRILQFN